jgi:hypothetical protein
MNIFKIMLLIFSFNVFGSSDIIVYTKTHASWNSFLIDEIQQIFANFSTERNFYSMQFENEKITYTNFEVQEFLTVDTVDFVKKIEEISRLGVLDSTPEFSLDGFGYDIENLNPIIDLENLETGIRFKTNVEINGLDIYAKSFNLNFVVPEYGTTKNVLAFQVKILNPRMSFHPGVTLPVKTDVNLLKNADGTIGVSLDHLDSQNLAQALKNSLHGVDFQYKELEISSVELLIMGQSLSIDKDKIKETINENKDLLKEIIVNQISNVVAKEGLLSLLKKYDNTNFKSNYWFNTKAENNLPFSLEVKSFTAIDEKIARVDIDGYFCSQENFSKFQDECKDHNEFKWFKNERNEREKQKSLEGIESKIRDPKTNLVISIGEEYITKLIHATIVNGQWDEILKEKGLSWGEQKAFIRFNKKGDRAQVYLDVRYGVGQITGLILSKRRVRFPIVLDIKTSVEYRKVDLFETEKEVFENEVLPHIVMNIMDVQMDNDTFWKGIPELGLETSISAKEIRYGFRGLVVKKIKEDLFQFSEKNKSYLKTWEGVELPPLIFPKIRNLHLEKLKHENDGNGRMNLSAEKEGLMTY